MFTMKYLIINADDFGMSQVFNGVILDLIKKNHVRSTTVMVNRFTDEQKEQFDELISLSGEKKVSVGLHLEFKSDDYEDQIRAQVTKFHQIFGFNPSHVDIHKAYSIKDSFPSVAKICKELNIPLRNHGILFEGVKSTRSEVFSGSKKDFNGIEEWIKTFKDGEYYEILFHPGKFDPDCKSSLNKEREQDAENIIKLNHILKKNNIKLASYLDLAATFKSR